MKFFNKLKSYAYHGYWHKRIISEIEFLYEMSKADDNKYDDRLNDISKRLSDTYTNEGAISKSVVLSTEDELSDLGKIAKEYDVSCIAHAHIDMNWMWGFQETACVTVDTFRTMLKLMEEYPEFTFSQSQASVYEIIEKYYPELLQKIKQRVKEGRWEITASSWVENDKNMSGSEAMARHLLYTKKYLSNLFEIDEDSLQIDFEPDTFGHNENMPEILSNGGVKYYYHCRGFDENHIYNWEAPSGEKILVFREPAWYNQTIDTDLLLNVPSFCKKYNTKLYLKVYGVGDHGGGPTRRDIERLIDMSKWPLMPTVYFSTLKSFFEKLEKERDKFETVKQELNYVFTGCYTSQSKIKRANKIGEDRLYASEVLDAQAKILCKDYNTASPFEYGWRKILFNQFHDILPGSGVVDTREYALGEFQKAIAVADINAGHSMETICKNIDTSSLPLGEVTDESVGAGVGYGTSFNDSYQFPSTEQGNTDVRIYNIFNQSTINREEVATLTLWDYADDSYNITVETANGEKLETQSLEFGKQFWGHSFCKTGVLVKLPPMGYTTVVVRKEKKSVEYTDRYERCDYISDAPIILENDKILAEFNHETMEVVKLVDKRTGKNYVDEPSCSLRFIYEEMSNGMSAWRVGTYSKVVNINRESMVKVTEQKHGTLKSFVKYVTSYENSSFEVTVSLDKNSNKLKFAVKSVWKEFGSNNFVPQLQFFTPLCIETPVSRCATPFGTVDRHALDHDVPCTGFMAVPDGDKAISLMSDCKYGFRNTGNGMLLDLIRSSFDPDKYPETGEHNVNIALSVTDYTKSDLINDYNSFVYPLSSYANSVHSGDLPTEMSVIKSENIQLSSVKISEDKEGIVVRLYNPEDNETNAKLTFAKAIKSAELVTITEKTISAIIFDKNTVELAVKPHSIETIKICGE